MEGENTALVNRVLKEYYEKNLSQKEIAYIEHVSKSTVSRIISRAKEEGIVQIELRLDHVSAEKLEKDLQECFDLEKVHVCPEILPDLQSRMQDVARSLAKDLKNLLQDGDILAVGCGPIPEMLAGVMPAYGTFPGGIRVVQACGTVLSGQDGFSAYRELQRFAEKLCAVPQMLSVPILMSSAALAGALRSEPQIAAALSLAEKADVCIFTAGTMENITELLRSGMIDSKQFGKLMEERTAGDVLFHFLDRTGNLADPNLDARTMSVSFEGLKKKRLRILAAAGEDCAESVLGILRAGIPNRVYLDERTAVRVLGAV